MLDSLTAVPPPQLRTTFILASIADCSKFLITLGVTRLSKESAGIQFAPFKNIGTSLIAKKKPFPFFNFGCNSLVVRKPKRLLMELVGRE